jgi:hypothetical protein
MEKVPENLHGDELMFDHSEYDVPKWTHHLYVFMNDMGFDCGYGDSGQAYKDDDVVVAVVNLGWAKDEYYEDEDSNPTHRIPDDPGITVYLPVDELHTTGDGKYYTMRYFEENIQPPLPLFDFEEA